MTGDAFDPAYLHASAAALRDDFEAAIAGFESILAGDPSSMPAALGLLAALVRVGRLDYADRVATAVIPRAAGDSGALTAVARLRERQGRSTEAAELLQGADLGSHL